MSSNVDDSGTTGASGASGVGTEQRSSIGYGVIVGLLIIAAAVAVTLFGPPYAIGSKQSQDWQAVFNIAGFIIFLGSIVAVIPVARHNSDMNDPFAAALVATAALIPTTITEFSTVGAYVLLPPSHGTWIGWVHNLALLIGASAGIVAWIFWAMFNRGVSWVDRQNASVYADLRQRYMEIRAAYESVDAAVCQGDTSARIACGAVFQHLRFLREQLHIASDSLPTPKVPEAAGAGSQSVSGDEAAQKNAGLRWVLATGYLDLWDHVHDAEEELIALKPDLDIVRGALMDAQRLQGSNVPNSKPLMNMLREAGTQLSPESAPYFDQLMSAVQDAPPGPAGEHDLLDHVALTVSSSVKGAARRLRPGAQASAQRNGEAAKRAARAVLRYVRHMINDFRSSRFRELVRRRNRLLEAVVFTRITSYGLLGLTILLGIPQSAIAAVIIYYLVGALTGLFSLLRAAPTSDAAVEDYGLASATLIQTTPFSGLAAVGGVLVVGLLGSVFAKNPSVVGLSTVFNLTAEKFGIGIIIAAIFGLTPSLLIARLQQAAQQFKLDLSSTEAHSTVDFPAS